MRTKIKINEFEDIIKFVQDTRTLNGDIVISQGQNEIDGKSLLGLFSLNLSDTIDVEYVGDNENEFDNVIKNYV